MLWVEHLQQVQKLEALYDNADLEFEKRKNDPNFTHDMWVSEKENSYKGLGADLEAGLSSAARDKWNAIMFTEFQGRFCRFPLIGVMVQ